jgi:MFS transporter, DHA2 family, multidrug resistance protein
MAQNEDSQGRAGLSHVQFRQTLPIGAVLLAAFLANFDTRLTSIGLADLRGAFSMSFDQGAWFSTATIGSQILVAPIGGWLFMAFGLRRVLGYPSLIFAVVSFAIPFSHDYPTLMALSAIHGALLGTFVPAALMVAFKTLPTKWWALIVAIYSIRVGFAVDTSPSAIGLFVQDLGWQWIYWLGAVAAPLMALLVFLGSPSTPANRDVVKDADWGGMLLLGVGTAMVYAGLDQGNRLDWFRSGEVTSLLIVGGVLVLGFLVNEVVVRKPWAQINVLYVRNVALPLFGVLVYALAGVSNSSLIPNFLGNVALLRPEQYGPMMLVYGALPMFVFVPLSMFVARHADPRWVLLLGFSAFAVANLMGTQVTHVWAPENFIPIVLLLSFAHAFLLFPILLVAISSLDLTKIAAFVAYVQLYRLIGAEVGAALMTTWLRIREQIHSFYLGQHVVSGRADVTQMLDQLSAGLAARSGSSASARATATLASLMHREANVLSYADGFWFTFYIAVFGIALVATIGKLPAGPFTPVPLSIPKFLKLEARRT